MKYKTISHNLFSCVSLLQDGQFHLGDKLGETLGMSRTGVWKIMNVLKDYGVEIEVNKSEGYRLRQSLILLDSEKILQGLEKKIPVDVFEFVTSTNDYLLSMNIETAPRVCIAEYQTAGRGRFVRSWQAPFGQSILLSYLYPCYEDVSTLTGLSLMIAVSLASVINHPDLKIKWPNDLYLNNKKLAGILIEVRAQSHAETKVVIGIGININNNFDSNQKLGLDGLAASLSGVINKNLDRNKLIINLLNQLEKDLIIFKQKGLPAFLEKFEKLDYLKGQEITLTQHQNKHTGIMMGIDSKGALLIKENDEVKSFSAGDTSLAV